MNTNMTHLTDDQIAMLRRDIYDISSGDFDATGEEAQLIVEAVLAIAAQPEVAMVPDGFKLVPIEPTVEMISAMACSKARDDEGEFPLLLDLIDYGGENKTHTVLKAAYRAMLAAAPTSAPTVQVDFHWPKLDKPAKVIGGTFGPGVSSRLVIESAQRQYEYGEDDRKKTPEQRLVDEINRRKLWDMLHGEDRLLQDEPGKDARKLSKALAGKLDARQVVRANTSLPAQWRGIPFAGKWNVRETRVYLPDGAGGFDLSGCPSPQLLAHTIAMTMNARATPPAAQDEPVGFVHPSTLGLLESWTNCAMFKPGHETEGSIALYTRQAVKQEPLSNEQIEAMIYSKHFRKGYIQKKWDKVCMDWYKQGLRDGEMVHGIGTTQSREEKP